MALEHDIQELEQRRTKARSMGGEKKLAALREAGRLNARERIGRLFDEGSFVESGLHVLPDNPERWEKGACDGKIAGFGLVENRRVGVISNDFTVFGASSSLMSGLKMSHIKKTCTRSGFPLVLFGESSGGRIPENMGASGMIGESWGRGYVRLRETPWANAIIGMAFGSSCWHACLADFNVVTKEACLAIASARLCSLATGEHITPEALGGWKLHSEITGLADVVANSDAEAVDAIKNFLRYMPSNNQQVPPRMEVPAGSDLACRDMLELIPQERSKVYDVRKVIKAIVDIDSMLELKSRYGRGMVTSLARIDGRVVGIVANNPIWKGGAMDADGCLKATSFLVLCDSFNIPIIFMVDQPGFLIGIEGEKRKMPGIVMNWMNAMGQVTVPTFSLQLRKSFGQGFLNMGGAYGTWEHGAWVTAETSFMDPEAAVGVVLGMKRDDDPEAYDAKLEEVRKGTSVYELARMFGTQTVLDPRESRDYLKDMLHIHVPQNGGIGKHLLHNWPTTF